MVSANMNSNKLRFHERKGKMVKLSNNHRTAERRRPYDEFNHGVVMTHRTLADDELFEIRIDRLVEKWSGTFVRFVCLFVCCFLMKRENLIFSLPSSGFKIVIDFIDIWSTCC